MTGALVLEQVTVRVAGRVLVDRLDLTVPAGGVVTVTGPAGSGKTTLLTTVAGVRPPAAGRIVLAGEPLTERVALRRVGYVPQAVDLFDDLTAVENVMLAVLHRASGAGARARAAAELLRLGLGGATHDNLAGQLSGGQRQRVAIARATVTRPVLIVADDPTSDLDPVARGAVTGLFQELADAGAAVLVATGDSDVAAVGHQRLVLGRGDGAGRHRQPDA